MANIPRGPQPELETDRGLVRGMDQGALACGFLGSAYGLWLIYAAGLHYLLMASVFIAIGIPVYIWSRKQHPDQNPMFLKYEKVLLVLLVLVALFSLYLFMRGIVKL